jgi:alpha-glucosidase (family GH31 glycosyl hydrolase)
MVETCHAMGVRVILWATSMIDTDSPNYKEGLDNGYFVL